MIVAYKVKIEISDYDLKWYENNTFYIDTAWTEKPIKWIYDRINDYKNTLLSDETITDIKIDIIPYPSDIMLFN